MIRTRRIDVTRHVGPPEVIEQVVLSLLTVTQAESHLLPMLGLLGRVAEGIGAEFTVVTDGAAATGRLRAAGLLEQFAIRHAEVQSAGYLESVLDEAVATCRGLYILRLDDDESPSPAMVRWLDEQRFLEYDHWKFPRRHLWPDQASLLVTPHLWPDHQTRLSVKTKAGGRPHIHAPSPFGGGALAPVAIDHLKFLVRSRAERERTAAAWHQGAMLPFSLPEDAYPTVTVVDAGDGTVPWEPAWTHEASMVAAEVAP